MNENKSFDISDNKSVDMSDDILKEKNNTKAPIGNNMENLECLSIHQLRKKLADMGEEVPRTMKKKDIIKKLSI